MSPIRINIWKKAVQHAGVDKKAKRRIENTVGLAKASIQGIAGDNLVEPVPNFVEAPSEKVFSNANNSWIVLGRDRPGARESGYGGKGDTQAASIDIVCGRMAHQVRTTDAVTGEKLYTDPDFKIDAARIYISQKTDLDENFGCITGRVGTSAAKSGIALKADALRFIAREGIKLISSESKRNSQGGDIRGVVGVDIIAGNVDDSDEGTDLQPMVKGNNLTQGLLRLTTHVENLNGLVTSFIKAQMEYNIAMQTHWHPSPFFLAPTAPSPILLPEGTRNLITILTKPLYGVATHKANLAMFKQTYLQQSGKKYICSRYNNVN